MASSASKTRSTRRNRKAEVVETPEVTETPAVDETPVATETATVTEEAKVEEEPKETAADRKRAREIALVIEETRLAFVVANARPALGKCLCGCESLTKGRFFPGHDATLKRDLAATVLHGTEEAKTQAQEALGKFGW